MTDISLMTSSNDPESVLPSLALLSHRVRVLPMDAASLVKMPENTILLLDARDDLAMARTLCRLVQASGLSTPIILILTEGGFAAVNGQWVISDVVVNNASPAEVEGRLKLVYERGTIALQQSNMIGGAKVLMTNGQIRSGDLVVDASSYTANLHGQPINLAYKEFELLKYLVQHPGQVFTRTQLLQEVWGYDYYGGTRTVDVHVRRLRAKLGSEYEHLIGTVRNVGYRFDPDNSSADGVPDSSIDEVSGHKDAAGLADGAEKLEQSTEELEQEQTSQSVRSGRSGQRARENRAGQDTPAPNPRRTYSYNARNNDGPAKVKN